MSQMREEIEVQYSLFRQ